MDEAQFTKALRSRGYVTYTDKYITNGWFLIRRNFHGDILGLFDYPDPMAFCMHYGVKHKFLTNEYIEERLNLHVTANMDANNWAQCEYDAEDEKAVILCCYPFREGAKPYWKCMEKRFYYNLGRKDWYSNGPTSVSPGFFNRPKDYWSMLVMGMRTTIK